MMGCIGDMADLESGYVCDKVRFKINGGVNKNKTPDYF